MDLKRRGFTFLLSMLMSMMGVDSFAHDIAVANADGVTIYYTYINNSTELAVSYRGDYSYSYDNEYTGDIVIPSSVTYNGRSYPVTSIGSSAFYNCSDLTNITIPNSVTKIGSGAFCNCSGLTSVTIPNSVTSIGNLAFFQARLYAISVDKGNTHYDSRDNCNAIIETANNKLIYGCISTAIPNSVTSIGDYAFYLNDLEECIIIPSSVTTIGDHAFSVGTLSSVIIEKETPIEINASVFDFDANTNATLYVPSGCKGLYQKADVWKDFGKIVEIKTDSPTLLERLHLIQVKVAQERSYMVQQLYPLLTLNMVERQEVLIKGIDSYIPKYHVCLSDFNNEAIRLETKADLSEEDVIGLEEWFNEEKQWMDKVFYNFSTYIQKSTITCNEGGIVRIGTEEITNGSVKKCWILPECTEAEGSYYGYIVNSIPFEELNIVAIPEKGYHVKSFIVNGVKQAEYTIDAYSIKDCNNMITVEFEPDDLSNKLTVSNVSVVQGGTVTLPVSMTNTKQIAGFQFDLTLPAGVSVATNSDGKYVTTLSTRAGDHTVSATSLGNNTYRFVVTSMGGDVFAVGEGTVITVMLKVESTVAAGNYTMKVKSELTGKEGSTMTRIIAADSQATLTVTSVKPGDANGDGFVTVTDVICIISEVLNETPDGFIRTAADVNGDGVVTVTDAIIVIDMVLNNGKTSNARRMMRQVPDPQ